jgi:Ca-activated chloride channel family protein
MRTAGALTAAAILISFLASGLRAQETQAEPAPVIQAAPAQAQPDAQKKAAPVERRASKPTATSPQPVAGPLTGAAAAQGAGTQPTGAERNAGTIRVETRLVNVALNVVDAHGTPAGGFEQKDFELFENGKPQTIAVFEREATSPLSIVLAIDVSETVLTSERLEKEAAKHFVQAILREQDELDLMEFADTVNEIVPFTNQEKRIEQALGQLEQGDETALYNAVYLASQRLGTTSQATGRRRVLVLISDGGDSIEHGEKFEQAVEAAQRADTMIYSIILVPVAADAGRNTGGEHALIQMSEDTGGKYYYVVDPSDLEPAFRHVSDDLRTQYLLGYYSQDKSDDRAFRRIRVKLTDASKDAMYSLRYRTGYFPDSR